MEIRTRLAPSPTGFLHIGTARTALFNWLFTRKNNGKLFLRIEDTDKERSKIEFEEDIKESLSWLGINWDEFLRQSDRKEIHAKYITKLLETGAAYVSKDEPAYRTGRGEGKGEVIRFKNPGKKVKFNDVIRGDIEFETKDLGDFVIAKDIQTPLYHLAVVVDDADMKISHVIRGDDHISNTPRQILIQEALGFLRPQYAHIPLILGKDRSKLSKRDGAEAVADYRKMGYPPEAMFNFLGLLAGLVILFKKGFPKDKEKFIKYILYFSVFYLVVITIPSKKLDRYILPSLMGFTLISGFVFDNLFRSIKEKKNQIAFVLISLFFLFLRTYRMHPDYFSYYNPLFGGLGVGINVIEPKWMIGIPEIMNYFDQLSSTKNFTFSGPEDSFEKIIDQERSNQVLSVGFPEKYYTQIWPFFRREGDWAVIKDLTPFAKHTIYFVYPVWEDDSNLENRFKIELIDQISVRGVPVYNVYRRLN